MVPQRSPPPPEVGKKPVEISDLPLDIVRNILLRLPSHEPEHLVRASAVCRSWQGTVADPSFQRSYRIFNSERPPVIGFLHNVREHLLGDFIRFLPSSTSGFTPRTVDHYGVEALDARHGRVLFDDIIGLGFIVWDPRTDEQWELPPPPGFYHSWAATLLCGDVSCDHLDCHGRDSLLVVFVGCDGVRTYVCSYIPAIGRWSDPSTADSVVVLNVRPATLVEQTLFFTTQAGQGSIVSYSLPSSFLSLLDPPPNVLPPFRDYFHLLPAARGQLRLATMDFLTVVQMWDRAVVPGGGGIESPWTPLRRIDIWSGSPRDLIPRGAPETLSIGFAEGHMLLYFTTGDGLLSVNLESGNVSHVIPSGKFYRIIPYQNFHMRGMSLKQSCLPNFVAIDYDSSILCHATL